MSEDKLDTLLQETRIYEPPQRIVDVAYVKKVEDYHKKAEEDLEAFWDEAAKELGWYEPYTQVLDESNVPFFKWFVNGKTNIVHNALDRHMGTDIENHVAIIYEGEPGDTRKITYKELNEEVCKFANALKKLGVKKGDRITTYLQNLIEHAVALLATAKLGAMHSVVYAGFSAAALRERIEDSQSKIVITADGLWRRGKQIPLKATVDEAVTQTPSVEKVIVVDRVEGMTVEMKDGRDLWYHDLIKDEPTECATEVMDSYDPLFILYTSGTTSKPKGVQHGHGGYQVGISRTLKWVFNIKKEDIWWCTADLGWITGHSYILYGPLILGTTSLMYESVPDYPEPDHWWELVEKYKVTKFYTAPTAIRAIARYGDDWVKKHDLSSLRILGSVGEPINPEAWIWYHEVVGNEQCPIMDTYWQTETGAFMLTPFPTQKLKPGSATKTFPGVFAAIVDGMGKELPRNTGGFLVIKRPWPSMLQTLYKNPDRYVKTYWSDIEIDGKPVYKTGDMARQDEDGYFWIQGRSDDVVNISGHRIGTMEVESAVVSHEVVAECAVIGVPDEIRGEILKAFVVLRKGIEETDELKITLKKHVRKEIGPIVVFKDIEFMDGLPKTRSGKIMRRVLKARELGLDTGDTSTLAD
jgi:acetyl-CoA synthetase